MAVVMTVKFLDKGDPPAMKFRDDLAHVKDGEVTLYCLQGGMQSGMPSVSFALEMPEGGGVIFETSARLLITAAQAVMAKYPGIMD